MPVKTIKIDMEAYRRLQSAKREEETLSQTIKRVVPKPFNLKAWFKKIEQAQVSEEVLDAVDEEIARRHLPINQERGRAAS
jgi:predicted CopG family antitoxin